MGQELSEAQLKAYRMDSRKYREVLRFFDPHTPRPESMPDARNHTCSKPSDDNKGCPVFRFCHLRTETGAPLKSSGERGLGLGPCQVVVENFDGVPQGEGRRFPTWCFTAFRKYFGLHKRPSVAIVDSRVYDDRHAPDGFQVLPAYEEQGPHYALRTAEIRGGPVDVSKRDEFERKARQTASARAEFERKAKQGSTRGTRAKSQRQRTDADDGDGI